MQRHGAWKFASGGPSKSPFQQDEVCNEVCGSIPKPSETFPGLLITSHVATVFTSSPACEGYGSSPEMFAS